jgi:hypothetical protein
VGRAFAKQVTSIGVMPVDFKVQHKSHVDKTMATVTAGFIPNDGNIENGGKAVKIGFHRVGAMVEAKRTTRKKGETDSTTGTYRMDGELSRLKGNTYWKNMEITGSAETSKDGKTQKFSLLVYFRDVLLKLLEDQARKHGTVIYFQWDGAGPHTCKKLKAFLATEFTKRGWIFKLQPSQSPITNINDACIFPSLSKSVSSSQALKFEGTRKILKGDEIFEAARQSWEDMEEATIGRAYAGHSQVVTALIEHDGDASQFTRGANKLHFGMRATYENTEDGVSVTNSSEVEQIDLIKELQKLKYKSPTFEELGGEKAIMHLQPDQRRILTNYSHPHLANIKGKEYKIKVTLRADDVGEDVDGEDTEMDTA